VLKKIIPLIIATLVCFGWQPAFAADSFQGTFWSLSTDGIDYDAGANKEYKILLTVDTSGFSPSGTPTPPFYIDQVAIKVSSGVTSASLLSAPGGLALWTTVLGWLNAGGCNGSGSGFDCVNSGANGAYNVVPSSSTYSWLFDLHMDSGTSLNFSTLGSSVKGRFVNSDGNKIGDLVSEGVTLTVTTPVPEPEIYAMMGLGLALLGWVGRRKRLQAA
jgi:PEP-CTERM motif-containing protein